MTVAGKKAYCQDFSEWARLHKENYVMDQVPDKDCLRKYAIIQFFCLFCIDCELCIILYIRKQKISNTVSDTE